ncbi:MAG: 2-keto-4-pentenoate hydratase [Blastocatellia bacterium]|jgi:2-keto-4-pentenoate hydratase|nr:2-keto-4-pentenoate hydratase [Blastocatellia bacterium]
MTNSINDDAIEQAAIEAAGLIREAYRTRRAIGPVRDGFEPGALDAGYAVQRHNVKEWIAEGRRPIGAKIGLTSTSIQKQLGVGQPDFGALFADMAIDDGGTVERGRLLQPRIEAEIALILDTDILVEIPTVADVVRAIAYVVPALEIVDSRITDWDISIVDTIADNASSGLYVLGGPFRRIESLDLVAAEMSMTKNGEVVSNGTGAACLGNPLNAATWLAGEMVRRGRPLRAGDVVLTGALGPMVEVRAGDAFAATISGVGSVRVSFQG